MQVYSTNEFLKDIRKISAKDKERLNKIIKQLLLKEISGKQLHHSTNTFSIRLENKRLIYQVVEKEDKLILLFFKSRADVYEYLK